MLDIPSRFGLLARGVVPWLGPLTFCSYGVPTVADNAQFYCDKLLSLPYAELYLTLVVEHSMR